jgi:hypothetical protein
MPTLEDLPIEQLLAHAKATESSHTLLRSLTSNPETRESLQRLIKKVQPNLSIPEIDAKDSVREEIKTEREARLALEQKILERDVRDRLEKQKLAVKRDFNLTDDDLLEVEKLMVRAEDPIPTYRGAAQVFAASRQSALPTPASYQRPTFQMPEKEVWAGGIGSPAKLNKIAMDEAYNAMGEIMSGKVAGVGPARAN